MADGFETVRVDKWLWAARLVKTRGLAVEAINGGRVEVNGQRVKPSKDLKPGDRLVFTTGPVRRELMIRALSARRGPATEAALLYDETLESRQARERHAEERRLTRPAFDDAGGRPTKRDRRRFDSLGSKPRER